MKRKTVLVIAAMVLVASVLTVTILLLLDVENRVSIVVTEKSISNDTRRITIVVRNNSLREIVFGGNFTLQKWDDVAGIWAPHNDYPDGENVRFDLARRCILPLSKKEDFCYIGMFSHCFENGRYRIVTEIRYGEGIYRYSSPDEWSDFEYLVAKFSDQRFDAYGEFEVTS